MAVGVVMDFEGTLEQYDAVIKAMGFEPGGPGAPGGLFHWVTKTDGGIRVTDVWENKEQFEAFAQSTIGPKLAEAGIAGEPEISFYEVHNYLTKG